MTENIAKNEYLRRKLLNIEQLHQVLNNTLQYTKTTKTNQRIYTIPINPFIIIDLHKNKDKINYFELVQIVLSINKVIPIILKKPQKIYWKNAIFEQKSKNARYKCKYCDFIIYYYNNDNNNKQCVYTSSDSIHSTPLCTKQENNLDLVYIIIKSQICFEVSRNSYNITTTTSDHYHNTLNLYQYIVPTLTLTQFPPYKAIKSTIYSKKLLGIIRLHQYKII